MSELVVASADPSDAAAVTALLDAAAVWQQSHGIQQWTPGWFGDEVEQAIADGELFVARTHDAVIGCFMLEARSPEWMTQWMLDHGLVPTEGAHVGRLAVSGEMAGQDLGIELLDVASGLAADRGLAYLRLDCPAENGRLRRYYLEAGFTYRGDIRTRGPNGEDWVSSLYERPTGTAPRARRRISRHGYDTGPRNFARLALALRFG